MNEKTLLDADGICPDCGTEPCQCHDVDRCPKCEVALDSVVAACSAKDCPVWGRANG